MAPPRQTRLQILRSAKLRQGSRRQAPRRCKTELHFPGSVLPKTIPGTGRLCFSMSCARWSLTLRGPSRVAYVAVSFPARMRLWICGVNARFGSQPEGQGCSEVRPVEGRSCSAALKSEDRNPKEGRNPKAEGSQHRTSNIEHPMAVAAAFQVLDVGCSMFRVSGLEWPGPTLEQPWVRGRMAANGSRRPGKGRALHLSSVSAFSTSGFKTAYPAALQCKPSSVKSRRSFPS